MERVGDRGHLLGGQGAVEQADGGTSHEPVAGEQDVDAHQQGNDRVEDLPAREEHKTHRH
jgi:hypothetical protein